MIKKASMKFINKKIIRKAECTFFYANVVLNLLPVISTRFVPTLDGPAHLYNATLIKYLLFSQNELLSSFFCFTRGPVPNWSGHFILSVFNLFLPGWAAEKILLVGYLVGLPIAFRYLVKAINQNNYFLCYLIFPFIYSYLFFLGFYNFCIALVFLFWTLGFCIRKQNVPLNKKDLFSLFILFTVTYFSHVFVFMVLLFIIFMQLVFDLISKEKSSNSLAFFKESKKKAGILLFTSFPAILMVIYYFYSHPTMTNFSYINKDELIRWLRNVRPVIGYNFIDEERYAEKIAYVLIVLCLIAFYKKTRELYQNFNRSALFREKISSLLHSTDVWLFASIGMLILYFKLPDSDGSAGYVTVRLELLFFMLLILWLSAQNLPLRLTTIMVIVTLFYSFQLNSYEEKIIGELNATATTCYEAADYIEPNSIVLPINYASHGMMGHFSNYLGLEKPVVILDNYECATGYFPLQWNDRIIPYCAIGNDSTVQEDCIFWGEKSTKKRFLSIDYVFILGIRKDSSECSIKKEKQLLQNYKEIYSSGDCKIYERNDKEKQHK
jgi:hypothetical protein